ncbi:MAG: DUF6301 family protein [Selenomonas noxia]
MPVETGVRAIRAWVEHPWPMSPAQALALRDRLGWTSSPTDEEMLTTDHDLEEKDASFATIKRGQTVASLHLSLTSRIPKPVRAEAVPIAERAFEAYVEDAYFSSVRHLAQLAAEGTADLMLMGIEPSYPSEKYGYIMPQDREDVSRVLSFREKPDEAAAKEYIEQGALWNSGVFAYRLGYVLERAQALLGCSGYETLLSTYDRLEKISFDYAVVEREKHVGVLRYAGAWKDLGTWNTLTEIMEEPTLGDVTTDDRCSGTHVVNELDVPILVMGGQDLIVAASPEGILVADKAASSHMKPYVEQISQPVMFAEKSWGSFRIIDVEESGLTIKVTLNAGHAMNYHSHAYRREIWNVVSGSGTVLLDGEVRAVAPGDVIDIPVGTKHKISAQERMVVIEVQIGEDIVKEDKIKWPEDGRGAEQ